MIALGGVALCLLSMLVCLLRLLMRAFPKLRVYKTKLVAIIFNSIHQAFNNAAIPILVPAFTQVKQGVDSGSDFMNMLPQLGIICTFILYPSVVYVFLVQNKP